ncbi:RDD family protein [Microbacterium suwonense]|uniref:FHA domain-containing protein n=1 Tax=Microbacterium suwonense TaxID=683047 RepID=A0ABM8FVM7_9MICO|nr:RDD family protein [Microbacterium suwonense]BDZ39586.1 hypothetical protein GCM10025863_22000 [Microbacterium suwonense]
MRATAGQRAGAYLIDVAIVAAAAALVWLTTGSLVLLVVAVVELWVIGWIWEGHTGGTPGNVICGIRTVRRDDAVSVGAARLFGRSLLMGVSHIVPVLLPISLAASGALDGVARARMIDLRRARQAVAPGADRMPNLEARVSATGSPVQDAAAGGGRGPVTQVPLTAAPITQTPLTAAPALSPAQHTAATPAAPTPAPAAAAHPAPTEVGTIPVFELADGTVIRATGLGFIGRAPRAPESIPEAILVRVPDGARSLSRTHASFGVEDGQLWVQDLGSANGASVRHLGGGVTALVPQSPYFLVAGDVLILGGDAELAFRRIVDRPARAAEPEALPIADAPSPQAAPASGAAVALQFQDGTTVPIHGTGYIGRAPSLPEGSARMPR